MVAKQKIKKLILRQFIERNYTNYHFVGAYIDTRLNLIQLAIDHYPAEQAAEIANELCRVDCLPEFESVRRTIDNFRRSIRAAVRGLWLGEIELIEFQETMILAIDRRLTEAWNAGAKECGIKPDELTETEIKARTELIEGQFQYLPAFGETIITNSKENGGKLGPFLDRAEMWISRYIEAKTRGAAMACGDAKRIWALGDTEHCKTCAALSGKIKRYSFWLAHVMPRSAPNPKLECSGWLCQCNLESTDQPISKGPLPFGL